MSKTKIDDEIVQLLPKLIHYLDSREHHRIVELFNRDGVWAMPHDTMRGRQEIRQALDARRTNRVSCHLITNLFAELVETDRASIHGYLLVPLFGDREGGDAAGAGSLGPFRISRCRALVSREADVWRIDEFVVEPNLFPQPQTAQQGQG
jgi:hypothetical protein